VLSFTLKAQILPKEQSVLNYRLIGFSFPPNNKILDYTLEIAKGSYSTEECFKENIVKTIHSATNKIIGEVPSFGSQYTWRAVYNFGEAGNKVTAFFHFSTGIIPAVDTSITRLKIIQPALKFTHGYVFLDDNKTLYDMDGNPVWYLPEIEGRSITPRDLKISPQGTITLMYDPPYEINYNGDVLWKAPTKGIVNGEISENYNHEFTKLSNGHYMVLGEDSAVWAHSIYSSKHNSLAGNNNDVPFRKMQFGTLIEYDEQGTVAWSWKSSEYFAQSDLRYFVPQNGSHDIDVHENSFYFDEKHNNIYISFKNINRIIKVKYPEGTVINTYGVKYKPGASKTNDDLFCGQHACKLSENGYLYLFNNNSCDSTGLPKVMLMEEPETASEGLKKIWEYDCTTEGSSEHLNSMHNFIAGGNVEELPDHSIFVCMSGGYSKLFIVSPEKEILWSAIPERKSPLENNWQQVSQYRASIIKSRKDLERLIWNAEASPSITETAHVLTSH